MKNIFSRYFGKVLSVIRKDGIFGGIKMISQIVLVLFRRPAKADILLVSSGAIGDSWRYRVKNTAEELSLHGFTSEIVVQENVWLDGLAKEFQIFIFHRVQKTSAVSRLIEEIKKQGKVLIFETDDLVFDYELLKKQESYVNANEQERNFYENMSKSGILDDSYVEYCTTTTDFLASKLREHGKKVFLVPNKLSKDDLNIADEILKNKAYNTKQECSMLHASCPMVRIGYFSGTMSHDKDFATVTDALMQIMERHENVELFLVGPLNIENRLNRFAERVKQFPYASREKHFANVASVDINIAPLEIENPFCQAKSELKFFEAGIVNVPTVAAATDPFVRAIEDGVDGFVANGTEQWTQKLEKLIQDENLRKEVGEKARGKALAKYTTENAGNEEYYAYPNSKLNN